MRASNTNNDKNNRRAEVSLNNAADCNLSYSIFHALLFWIQLALDALDSSFVMRMWDFSGKRSICSFRSQ